MNESHPSQLSSPTSIPPTVLLTPTFQEAPTDVFNPTVTISPVSLPLFPWPVPKPSALEVLTLGSLGKLAGTGITFRDVEKRISNALDSAGYDDKSYFGVPGGFAIVTRLEKMDAYGFPDYRYRWASALPPISFTDFSLSDYLRALFGAPKGHYRVFVFVVSSEPVLQSGTPVAQLDAQTWIVEGANRLPNQMEDLPYTREHRTTAYVYEFVQSGIGETARFNIPSDFTGKTHLKRADLWENLNADTSTPTINPNVNQIFQPGSLEPGYDMGVDSSGGLTDWVTVSGKEICMAYPSGQAWGAVFITIGKPTNPPRPSQDLSEYKKLSIELRGADGGESILVGIKDNTQPNDGSETKYHVTNLTTGWTTVEIPLMEFTGADLKRLYVVTEFVFENISETVCVRNIRYLR